MAPGPNDYHMKGDEVLPGLGKDEPSDEQRAGARIRGQKALEQMRARIDEETAALSVKEQELLKKEQELEKREALLKAAESKAGR